MHRRNNVRPVGFCWQFLFLDELDPLQLGLNKDCKFRIHYSKINHIFKILSQKSECEHVILADQNLHF